MNVHILPTGAPFIKKLELISDPAKSGRGNKEYLDLFYQKLLKIDSIGDCGEEKAPQNCFAISGVKV